MTEPEIHVQLGNGRTRFQPGEELVCRYRVQANPDVDVRAVEASVLWYTEGKGDEDLGVHFFERKTRKEDEEPPWVQPCTLRTVLPPSPLSYEGVIVKIRWCVRVRVFLPRGRQWTRQISFVLGHVAPAQPVQS